jgi:DNA-binding MarR family transcriptional regulator
VATTPSLSRRDEVYGLLEHELGVLLRRARGASGSLARQVHPDLDAAAYGLLARIDEAGTVRVTDLAAFFGVGKPTVSRQVALLEQLDLVARATDDGDARSRLVTLTPRGRERLGRAREARRTRMREQLRTWSQEDVAAFARLLARYNDAG